MTLKSDAKFEEKLALGSKNNMRNLVNFNESSSKSENLHFDLLLWSIACKVSAKKVTFCLKNDVRNLVNFNASSGKSKNLHFDGSIL